MSGTCIRGGSELTLTPSTQTSGGKQVS